MSRKNEVESFFNNASFYEKRPFDRKTRVDLLVFAGVRNVINTVPALSLRRSMKFNFQIIAYEKSDLTL